jgi:hypothetical protein
VSKNVHQGREAEFTPDLIVDILRSAVTDLYQNESDINCFSSETGQTEWNLAAHLAPEVAKYFEGYSYDIDVMKVNHHNRRPDIIIHRRGANTAYNLLVVEVKRDGSTTETAEDAKKIREHWFSAGLAYKFGATINLITDQQADIEVFHNAKHPSPPEWHG